MNTITNNITNVQRKINQLAQQYGRQKNSISLLAVSKTQPISAIKTAYDQGLRDFGENYLQEALEKIEALSELNIVWHFIGPIQSNKTKAIAEYFQWVHSVDRLKIAQRLSKQRPTELPPLNICLQVNVSHESTKSGVNLTALPQLVNDVMKLPNLQLRGLMAIPAPTIDETKQRFIFKQLHDELAQLHTKYPQLSTLSMGMSQDLSAAIAEGSTIVRVGTNIFGPRAKKM